MTFLVYKPRFMLFKPFGRGLTGHTDIKTFQHSIELWIGNPESGVFGKHPL